jgi:hypothetical protein
MTAFRAQQAAAPSPKTSPRHRRRPRLRPCTCPLGPSPLPFRNAPSVGVISLDGHPGRRLPTLLSASSKRTTIRKASNPHTVLLRRGPKVNTFGAQMSKRPAELESRALGEAHAAGRPTRLRQRRSGSRAAASNPWPCRRSPRRRPSWRRARRPHSVSFGRHRAAPTCTDSRRRFRGHRRCRRRSSRCVGPQLEREVD